tara:strand:- start:341 stop:835 length:495 start_codon:yes stop_codon:yes gene_type:complete
MNEYTLPQHVTYELWYNETSVPRYLPQGVDPLYDVVGNPNEPQLFAEESSYVMSVQRGVDEALLAWHAAAAGRAADEVEMNLELFKFPEASGTFLKGTIEKLSGATFLYLALQGGFLMTVQARSSHLLASARCLRARSAPDPDFDTCDPQRDKSSKPPPCLGSA